MSEQQYNNAQPIVNKMLNPDGSVTTIQGEIPIDPHIRWQNAQPFPNKTLEPDGSIGVFNFGSGGGSGGTSNYNDLTNKPKINNVTLIGNKTSADLGVQVAGDYATNVGVENLINDRIGDINSILDIINGVVK